MSLKCFMLLKIHVVNCSIKLDKIKAKQIKHLWDA